MITRPTVRLSRSARADLDDVVYRTERAMSWILVESLTDLGRAVATAGGDAAALYATAPEPGDITRFTLNIPEHLHGIVLGIARASQLKPAEIVRAAWMRWRALYSVDEIVAKCGEVKPARTAS